MRHFPFAAIAALTLAPAAPAAHAAFPGANGDIAFTRDLRGGAEGVGEGTRRRGTSDLERRMARAGARVLAGRPADRVREPRERGVQHERRHLRPQRGRQRNPDQPHGRQHGRRPGSVLVARRDEGRLLEHPELGDRSLRHGGRRNRDGPAAHDGRRRRDGSGMVAGRRDDRLRDRSRRQRGPLGDRCGRHGPAQPHQHADRRHEHRPVVVSGRLADRVQPHGGADEHLEDGRRRHRRRAAHREHVQPAPGVVARR